MSVKLGRYVWRRIGGRIIPIRIGAAASDLAGVSKKALRKLKTMMKSDANPSIGRTGKLRVPVDSSGTDAMEAFMRKSGAVRFHSADGAAVLSFSRKITDAQRRSLLRYAKDSKEVIAGYHPKNMPGGSVANGSWEQDEVFNSVEEFLRAPHSRKGSIEEFSGKGVNQSAAQKLTEKAKKYFGTTNDPREAGYITRDGDALDLSGKKMGGSRGVRHLDHREVGAFMPTAGFKKMSDKDIRQALRRGQMFRKSDARRTHRLTTLEHDIRKMRGATDMDRKEKNDVTRTLVRSLRELRKQRGK